MGDVRIVYQIEARTFIKTGVFLMRDSWVVTSVLKGRVGSGHGMFPLTSDLAWSTFSATCLTSDPDLL